MINKIITSIKKLFRKSNSIKSKNIFNFFNEKDIKMDVFDSNRNEVRLNFILTKINCFLSLICLFLVFVIITLLPLKEKEPYFVTFLDKGEQIVYLEPYKTSVKQQIQQKEFLARYYVKLRETFDLKTDLDRMGQALFYATKEQGAEHLRELDTTRADSPYRIAVEKNMTSSVEIVTSSVLNENQIQVEFIVTNKIIDKVVNTKLYLATVTFVTIEPTYRGETYLVNPLWFRVSEYHKSSKAQYNPNNLN